MIKKVNKKMLFGFSLFASSILSVLFSISKKSEVNILDLITEVPLSSIERVSATDGGGGDCSGSSDGGWNPGLTNSGVGISIEAYSGVPNWTPATFGGY